VSVSEGARMCTENKHTCIFGIPSLLISTNITDNRILCVGKYKMAHYLHLPSVRYPHMATTSNFLNHTLCIHDTLCLRSTHVFVSPPIQWLICPHQITGYINCKISHCITEDNTGLSWPTYHAILSPTPLVNKSRLVHIESTARHMVSASAVDSRKSETCHRLDGTVCYNTRVWHNDVLAIKHSNVPCHVSKKNTTVRKNAKDGNVLTLYLAPEEFGTIQRTMTD